MKHRFLITRLITAVLTTVGMTAAYAQQSPAPASVQSVTTDKSDTMTASRMLDFALMDASESVGRLLQEGHLAIRTEQGKARFARGRDLFRKALKEAQKKNEAGSLPTIQKLLDLAEKAVLRYRTAELSAKQDVAEGRFCYKEEGLMAGMNSELVYRKYGIQVIGIAGCDASYEEMAEVEGYNSVALPTIRNKFGKAIADEVVHRKSSQK